MRSVIRGGTMNHCPSCAQRELRDGLYRHVYAQFVGMTLCDEFRFYVDTRTMMSIPIRLEAGRGDKIREEAKSKEKEVC